MQNDTKSNEIQTPDSVDGYSVGQSSTSLVGFFGATPVAQPSSASQAAVTALGTVTISAITGTGGGIHGFSSSTQAAALVTAATNAVTLVNQIRSELVTLGLIAGS